MDIGSANGTWTNSKRLMPHPPHLIKSNDQLWLGQLILLAYLQSAPAS
jgi:pSer/pThr/pTyr-binding forkhead associated (FHA) protein